LKLATFASANQSRVGIVEGDRIVPVTNHPDMLSLIEAGPTALTRLATGRPVDLHSVRLLAPIPQPPR
jgi:hypothetical protein